MGRFALSHAAKAAVRFLLLIGAIVCFGLAAAGISPHPTQDDALGWMGAAFLTITALFLDPENPPDVRTITIEDPHD